MKKLIFTLLFAGSVAASAQAQIQQGNVMVGTNLSNINFSLDKPNAFSLAINPKAAWFVDDGVAVGGDVKFGLEAPGKGLGTTINYGIGALGRYYGQVGANELIKSSRFFGEATVGVAGRNLSGGGSTNGLGFSFGPGFTYFITRSIGLEALLKYEGTVGFGSSAYAHDLNLGVGFQIYLPGRSTARKVDRDLD
ncbi:outer membrane beta-barrel protein [Pedobacter sp. SYP-B3415]|uniref:outer membrane beta-barrel protein n=1 Tax=Pedobacter sp. SYP-B3415 TaxID=2496641 RepID=UPI00101BA921|nr:outer membrane beta-barrel protein [Pedobacter sp. SYP-B3415]